MPGVAREAEPIPRPATSIPVMKKSSLGVAVALALVGSACHPSAIGSGPVPGSRSSGVTSRRPPPTRPSRARVTRALQALPSGWSRLPPVPGSPSAATNVWTGRDLIVWSGMTADDTLTDAARAFDPVSSTWRRLPNAPVLRRYSAPAVWTGREVVIWGGVGPGGGGLDDGAAFNPRTNTWRRLAPSPLSARDPVAMVWTGTEVLVWGSTERPDGARDGAAYDPRADVWRRIAPAPVRLTLGSSVWTGRELLVYGATLDDNNHSRSQHPVGAAYNPRTDEWRKLPPFDLSPQASALAWSGEEMIVWDYELHAGAYDPESDSWRRLPHVPLSFSECYPTTAITKRFMVAEFCGTAAVLDLHTDEWLRIPSRRRSGAPVAAGPVFLFPGFEYNGITPDLQAYNPG